MKKVSILTLLSVLIVASAWGEVGGRISGVVKDQTGAVVPRAPVVLRNTATGVPQTVSTDNEGNYSFTNLAVGRYDLNITLHGFKPYRRSGLASTSAVRCWRTSRSK